MDLELPDLNVDPEKENQGENSTVIPDIVTEPFGIINPFRLRFSSDSSKFEVKIGEDHEVVIDDGNQQG